MKTVLFYLSTFAVILPVTTFLVATLQPPPVPEAVADSVATGQGIESPAEQYSGEQPVAGNAAYTPESSAVAAAAYDSLQTVLDQAQQEKMQFENEIAAARQQKSQQRSENFEKMTKEMAEIYENMAPAQAAMIISNLETDVAVTVIAKMKKRQAAKILGAMEPYKAIELSKLMAQL